MMNYDLGYEEGNNRKMIFAIIAVLAIGILAIAGYYLSKKGDSGSPFAGASPSLAPSSFICGVSTVSDIDNNIYRTVKIGGQCWLKDNLKVTKNPSGEAITRYCYKNNPGSCDITGGLYDWNTAMDESRTSGAQGICPNGWHIPRDSEWYILENGLAAGSCISTRSEADCDPAGMKLRSGGDSGFEGIFAGYRNDSAGLFYGQGIYAYFWSSLESGDGAWNRNLSLNISAVYRNPDSKSAGFSVRCLKD